MASIVTPATLSIRSAPVQPAHSHMYYVPNLDFRSLDFSADIAGYALGYVSGTYETLYWYGGPSLSVQRVVGASALQRQVLPVSTPHLNASWVLEFLGPSLKCQNVRGEARRVIQANIANATFTASTCVSPPLYVSWFEPYSTLPYTRDTDDQSTHTLIGKPLTSTINPYRLHSRSKASIYFALMPFSAHSDLLAPWNPATCGYTGYDGAQRLQPPWTTPLTPAGEDDTTIIQCDLLEAKYELDFRFLDGGQIIIRNVTNHGTPMTYVSSFTELSDNIVRQLSYQSVMESFATWTLGTIQNGASIQTPFLVDSSVLATPLGSAQEMQFVASREVGPLLSSFGAQYLQEVLAQSNVSHARGVATTKEAKSTGALIDIVEDLFQNITISLMSSPDLQPNQSSLKAPQKTNVTYEDYHNIYIYSRSKLWLAYGLAIASTVVAVAVGLFAMFEEGACYSNNYSTVLRTSKGVQLSIDIKQEDTAGRDPLPSYIADAKVRFTDGGVREEMKSLNGTKS